MPEPTNTASAPSCILRAASAGVAMPPAEKFGTGSRPFAATHRTSSYGAPSVLASVISSSAPSAASRLTPDTTARMWRTASTMLPEPASPFVRIIAAPSPMRRSASPRSRAPQTKGIRNANLSMWKCSSAGVRTSDSSMKSAPSASRIWASTKWPIRALAITGIVTAAWISLIFFTEAMRATPPSRRMSAGTRSSAITAAAPAASAILACSAFVTSMITPPFSISASPMCLRSAILSPLVPVMPASLLSSVVGSPGGRAPSHDRHGRALALHPGRRAAAAVADRVRQPPDAFVDPGRRHRRKREPERPFAPLLHEERRPRREGHAPRHRAREQGGRVQPLGQREQQREASPRFRPADVPRHPARERLEQAPLAAPVLVGDPGQMPLEQPALAEVIDRGLDQGARLQVRELLGRLQPLEQRARRHEPAEPQPGEQDLRERPDVDHESAPVQRPERRRGTGVVVQAAVETVLDDRHAPTRADLQEPPPPVPADRQAGRVVGARLAVEELRGVALDGALERVRARAVLPERDRREPGAERAKHLHRPRVGRPPDGGHVPRIEQGAGDPVETLLRAVDDQDVVGQGFHPEAEQVTREEPAERRVARGGVVLEQLLALLADHRVQHPAERVRREHRAVRHAAGERDQPRGQAPGEGSEPPPLPFAEADPRAPREEPRPVDRRGQGARARAVG